MKHCRDVVRKPIVYQTPVYNKTVNTSVAADNGLPKRTQTPFYPIKKLSDVRPRSVTNDD